MRYSVIWYAVFALLALAWGALLVLSGCEDDGQCRPSVKVVAQGDVLTVNCGPCTTVRVVPVGDGQLLRSAIVCDCPAGSPPGFPAGAGEAGAGAAKRRDGGAPDAARAGTWR